MLAKTRLCGISSVTVRNVSYLPKKLDYYGILGVKRDATAEEIKLAFVKRSNELHPDRGSKAKDTRLGWGKTSDTERFMQMKEAYDCLRNPIKRSAYDDQLSTSAGYLREATHLKFQQCTILDLNKARDDNYTGPRGPNASIPQHFRDLEEEYFREKHKNRLLVVIACIIACLVLANIGYVCKDYYQVLGVQRDATQRQIKLAYYQLSKKYHPDIAGRNEGTEAKFIEISEAYECLKDPERRRTYDNEISGSGGRYTGDPYGYTDFRHFAERQARKANGTNGNPFFSQRYTQQEYERIWEQFNRMRSERETYDERIRREREKVWEEFARQRAERWKKFHDKYPDGPPGSFQYEWRWTSTPNPRVNTNIEFFTRLITIYMIVFILVSFIQVITEPYYNAKKWVENKEGTSTEESEQTKSRNLFEFMNQPPLIDDNWNTVISHSSYPSSDEMLDPGYSNVPSVPQLPSQ